MTARFSVTVRQVREDGSEAPLEGELAAALAAPAEQFAGLAAWAAEEAGYLDHGEQGEGDRPGGPGAAAAAAAGHVRRRCRPGGAGRGGHQVPRGSVTAPWRPGTAGAWPACSGRSGSPGWPTGTGGSRTCYRLMPGRSCRRTRTPWGCGPWRPLAWQAAGRAGPGGHRGPDRRHGRPRPAHRAGRGPRGLDGRLLCGEGTGRGHGPSPPRT